MKSESDLPADVIAAIRANRKIDAIKSLREARGLGLKEAKHAVEAFMRANPNPVDPTQPPPGSSASRLILILAFLFAGYALYKMFV